MPNYRTINQCHSLILAEDKDSAISLFFIRKLCQQNHVKHLKAGNKILVDYTSLINFLKGEI